MVVQISANLNKRKESIDANGNTVVPFTKQIIKSVDADNYIPTPEELQAITNPKPVEEVKPEPVFALGGNQTGLSVQQQIDEAKKQLAQLEELKKLKIAEMKAELELLQSE
jgi:hypothetical protein